MCLSSNISIHDKEIQDNRINKRKSENISTALVKEGKTQTKHCSGTRRNDIK